MAPLYLTPIRSAAYTMNEAFSFRRQPAVTSLSSFAFGVSLTSLLLIWPQPCYAYLDPSTGSLVLSTIIGVIAGLMVTIKMAWHNILTFLGIRNPEIEDRAKESDSDSKSSLLSDQATHRK
jgi:hypothetical protein